MGDKPQKHVKLDEDTHKRLTKLKRKTGKTIQFMVNEAVEDYLREEGLDEVDETDPPRRGPVKETATGLA